MTVRSLRWRAPGGTRSPGPGQVGGEDEAAHRRRITVHAPVEPPSSPPECCPPARLHQSRRRVGTLAAVRYVRLIASIIAAAALAALCAPQAALAGSYSWSQPGDFSGTQGALKYRQPSWYYDAGSPSSSLTPLTYSGGTWSDVLGDSVSVSEGDLIMHAATLSAVTVEWSDPFGSTQPVTVTYTHSASCLSVTDQNGNAVASGAAITGSLYATVSGGATLGCSEDLQVQLEATTPAVTLTTPANGAAILPGAPQFAGIASTAFDASGLVAVNIYAGGSLVQTLTAPVGAGGSYSVTAASSLPSGTYTAQAEQEDPVGQANFSAPVTFTVSSSVGPSAPSSAITLDSPGSKPLLTSTPTLTGTAGTQPTDANQAALLVYSGSGASGSPERVLMGSVGSGGRFAVQVTPALSDGAYTAYAAQSNTSGGVSFSSPVEFRVKVHPPALTLAYPGKDGAVPRSSLFFSGQAGSDLGDSATVTVELWRGPRARGKALGKTTARVQGSSWSLQWPHRLADGRYAIRAQQVDDAGHTTLTSAHSFSVVPGPPTIGSVVSLAHSDRAGVRVSCLPRAQGACRGTVLVVSSQSLRTTPGGPAGPLRVLFAYVTIPAGQTAVVRSTTAAEVARALRGAGQVTVRVTVALRHGSGPRSSVAAERVLKISP